MNPQEPGFRTNGEFVRRSGPRRPEQGQAIVLIALLMIVLLGLVGLAVDGGALYLKQREMRNAIDAALMSASYELCMGGTANTVRAAGYNAAALNGFNNDGVTNTVNVSLNTHQVTVTIRAQSPTYLIHLVHSGPAEVTARGVGRCRLPEVAYPGQALVALHATAGQALKMNGNGSTRIVGGGAFSNSSASDSMKVNGNGSLSATGGISGVGGYVKVGNGYFDTNGDGTPDIPVTGASPINDPLAEIGEPANPGSCTNISNINNKDNVTLTPGCYTGLQMTGGSLTLQPGIYYFTGNVKITGGSFLANNVMIFMKSGSFELAGAASVSYTAPLTGSWAGMALYMARGNTSGAKIVGQGNFTVSGTIYAPSSDVDIRGVGSGNVMYSQVLASTVQVGGNGQLDIIYDPGRLYKSPPKIEIEE